MNESENEAQVAQATFSYHSYNVPKHGVNSLLCNTVGPISPIVTDIR